MHGTISAAPEYACGVGAHLECQAFQLVVDQAVVCFGQCYCYGLPILGLTPSDSNTHSGSRHVQPRSLRQEQYIADTGCS